MKKQKVYKAAAYAIFSAFLLIFATQPPMVGHADRQTETEIITPKTRKMIQTLDAKADTVQMLLNEK